jgi:hypothetical protein
MAWSTAGIQTNPATDFILADTGALTDTLTRATIVLGGSAAMIATLEHRNAANSANLNAQVFASPINVASPFYLDGLSIAPGERLRLRLNAAVTGSVQASIFTY